MSSIIPSKRTGRPVEVLPPIEENSIIEDLQMIRFAWASKKISTMQKGEFWYQFCKVYPDLEEKIKKVAIQVWQQSNQSMTIEQAKWEVEYQFFMRDPKIIDLYLKTEFSDTSLEMLD